MRKSLCTGRCAPTGSTSPCSKRPQQLHLQRQGDVGHLVEEDRAAVGLFQQSLAGLVGAGERAADVAEQLALGQRGAERGDVDGHERPVRAAAVAMDRPGDQFLAGAALAAEVDAGVGGGDQGDALEDLLHGRRACRRSGRRPRAGRRSARRPARRGAGRSARCDRPLRPPSGRTAW